ncbi:MAG TPA: hypothetical protein VGP72_23375 [Planctomycetota bacterium]|jgi:tetratricopeptide (TPR) repeat protein
MKPSGGIPATVLVVCAALCVCAGGFFFFRATRVAQARDAERAALVKGLEAQRAAAARAAELTSNRSEAASLPNESDDVTSFRYAMDLLHVHLNHGALGRAEEMLRIAESAAKDPAEKQQALTSRGVLLQRKKDWTGAAACYEELLKDPGNGAQRVNLGMTLANIYQQAGENAKAEELLLDVSEDRATPGRSEREQRREAAQRTAAWRQLVALWQQQDGKLAKVLGESEKALAKNPEDMALLERVGDLYGYGNHDPKKVSEVYRKLADARPNDATWLSRLADTYQQAKEFGKAADTYRKIAGVHPGMAPGAHLQAAHMLLQAGKQEEAVAWAKEHVSNQNNDVAGPTALESFFCQMKLVAEAQSAVQAQLKTVKAPQLRAECMFRLAEYAQRLKDFAAAEEQIKALLVEFEDNAAVREKATATLRQLNEEQRRSANINEK